MTAQPPKPRNKGGRPKMQLTAIVTVNYVPCPPEKFAAYQAALRYFYADRKTD